MVHRAVRADDLDALALGCLERALERRREPATEVEPAGERRVHPRGRRHRRGRQLHRRPLGRQQQRRQAVDADVEQRAAAHRRRPAVVRLVAQNPGEGRPREPQLAQAARAEDLGEALRSRVERRHVGLEQQHAGGVARRRHRARLEGGGGQRLLAQHVLAGLGGLDRPLGVEAVGERDVDGFHVGIAQDLVVGPKDPLGAEVARTRRRETTRWPRRPAGTTDPRRAPAAPPAGRCWRWRRARPSGRARASAVTAR